jgi:hypothetical protein
MKAYTTPPLNAFHLGYNSMTAFDFRRYPTFSHVERSIHDDKCGWSATVYFKSGNFSAVSCRGYDVTINGTPFTHGDINKACVLLSDEPTRRTHY